MVLLQKAISNFFIHQWLLERSILMVGIELVNLCKNFSEEKGVNNLNLKIETGEILALLGPSGCGKTTTLKLIAGLMIPDKGDILLNQKSIINIPAEKREVVLVFQDYLLFPHLSVADNIAFGLQMAGKNKNIQQKRVKELLELINLKGYEDIYPDQLSGGEKQRVALARAIAVKPEVLLLDEPLSNLDRSLREEMQQFIIEIHNQEKMTTLFVTHDREEAMLIADRVAVMHDGYIEQCAEPEKLYKNPFNRFVSEFLGTSNFISGRLENGKFLFNQEEFEVSNELLAPGLNININQKVDMLVRPEFISLVKEPEKKQAENISGKIIKRNFLGDKILYTVEITDGQLLSITALPSSPFHRGEQVFLQIDWDNVWFIKP